MHAVHAIVSNVSQSHVPANIRAEVARAGKNQADIAELLGITRQAVSQRMLGRVDFRISEITAIANYLGVPSSALIDGTAA